MSFTQRTGPSARDRSARSPWSTEPELPPDASALYAEPGFDARAALADLAEETRTVMTELAAEIDELRPLLATEDSAQSAYVSMARRLAAAERTAVEVHAARVRLNEGTYGYCVNCTERIPTERLQVRPHSRLCVPCS